MGNLEYSFDNILKSYIDIGKQLTEHQVNLISSNKGMLKTYLRKRVIAVKKTKGLYSDKELELLKKYDKKSYDDYMNYISTLKELDLTFNQLTSLPEGINNLTNLEKLDSYFNKLTSLEGIENLTNLKEFSSSHNNLTSLPDWIGNLKNLVRLYLENNELTTLPESIGNLTNLKVLYLNNNELISLPNSIGKLINLNDLWLQDNPISDEEKERIKKLLPNTKIYF